MRKFIVIGIVIIGLSVALGLSLSSGNVLREDNLGISVSQVGNRLVIKNTGTTDCVIFFTYPNGVHQRIVVNATQTFLLDNPRNPIEFWAVSNP